MDNIFLRHLNKLDLHGYTYDMAFVKTNDFVSENILLDNDKVVIIHGIGMGIVKRACHEALKTNKYVKSFKLDNFNIGCTIVELKKN